MSRFEIVRTDAEQPWHARFVASNGRIVFSTETYARRAGAIKALRSVAAAFSYDGRVWVFPVPNGEGFFVTIACDASEFGSRLAIPVLNVDERVGS